MSHSSEPASTTADRDGGDGLDDTLAAGVPDALQFDVDAHTVADSGDGISGNEDTVIGPYVRPSSAQQPNISGLDSGQTQPGWGGGATGDGGIELTAEGHRVGDKLGAGGMGDVFAARDQTLNREVAVKMLARRAASPMARQRFHREAQVTAQLSHPNVVPVYSLTTTTDDLPAMTMKLVHGVTFFEYIKQCRANTGAGTADSKYSRSTRIEHFLKVCDAMAYSHSCGVLHRDIKPQNFMLGAFHEVYVMDWGMARVVSEGGDEAENLNDETPGVAEQVVVSATGSFDSTETRAGSVMGTPQYMAPEQAVGDWAQVGAAADQFSLGLVLYELLTLQRCRTASTVVGMLGIAAEAPKLSYTDIAGPAVAPALRSIVAKATAPKGDRPLSRCSRVC